MAAMGEKRDYRRLYEDGGRKIRTTKLYAREGERERLSRRVEFLNIAPDSFFFFFFALLSRLSENKK